jgi:zinc protease
VLNNLTVGDMRKAAAQYLPYQKMIIVVVGDKASNFEKVQKLGYEVIELDVNGKEVK